MHTAPTATIDSSVSTTNGSLKYAKSRTVRVVNDCFCLANSAYIHSVQLKVLCTEIIVCSDAEMETNDLINLL